MSYGEKTYEQFRVGDTTTFTKTITEADILLFAAVSGDNYPLHVDAEYAKTTRFGARAAHGMLTASLLSTVIGLMLQITVTAIGLLIVMTALLCWTLGPKRETEPLAI